jgi:hypothetical protein
MTRGFAVQNTGEIKMVCSTEEEGVHEEEERCTGRMRVLVRISGHGP